MSVHPTACIEEGAVIGADVEVGPFNYVAGGTIIGDGCRLGPHVTVLPFTELGRDCRVHAQAVLGGLPQDLKFNPETISRVRIGDRCVLREGVTVHRGTEPESITEIGTDCLLMATAHVGHNCRVGNHVILVNGAMLGGHVQVGERALISGNAGVHQFVRIGRYAMLGGTATATQDVPPFCILRSGSLNRLSGLNTIGLRRAGIDSATRLALRSAFLKLFHSGTNRTEAVALLEAENPVAEVRELLEFIRTSTRGVCNG